MTRFDAARTTASGTSKLKRNLAHAHGTDLVAYSRNKDDFVNEVLGVGHASEAPPVTELHDDA